MKSTFTLFCKRSMLLWLAIAGMSISYGQDVGLSILSSVKVGDEGAAEIVAYDALNQRLWALNNVAESGVRIYDLSDVSAPAVVDSFNFETGEGNSIAIYDSLVAVAVDIEGQNGNILVYSVNNFSLLATFEAGNLPDMVTFSNNGQYILSANEGEPNDAYDSDPEGSITIVDLSAGLEAAEPVTIGFTAFNDQQASLINSGVRIFGPGATVAQDLEPEYISVTADDSLAYVICQENNAFAVVDIKAAEVIDILPLGYKDHAKGTPILEEYLLNELLDLPELGVPTGQEEAVKLSGFSGLFFDAANSTAEEYVFYTIPDRGPNAETVSRNLVGTAQNLRPFKLPDYQARIVKFTLNPVTGEVSLNEEDQIFLTAKDGTTPISGKGNVPGFDEVPVVMTEDTSIADFIVDSIGYQLLEYDPFGGDFEGILRDGNGEFWMCDEYRPAIYHFDSTGVLIERFVPEGTSLLGDTPQDSGFYGAETLPAVYSKRRANRGFEAIALDTDAEILYAFIQTAMDNPGSEARNSDVIRILGIDPATGEPISEYVYFLEKNRNSGVNINRVDKIGDAVYTGGGKFLILERDSSVPGSQGGKKFVFEIDLKGATNILGTEISNKMGSTGEDDKTLEMMTADEIVAMGIQPVFKNKVVNLPSIGYLPSDKPEGLALLPDGAFAVINDNDFGIAGAGITDDISLGIVSFEDDYGFDASNESEMVDITNHPTLGMYQPDAIATYEVNGISYIVTANEGDARDYDGFSEEERVEDFLLDSTLFPNAAELQLEENLGRLKTTNTQGDLDGDGDYDIIYSYGARSFSIFDQFGNLVYDSGDDFEQITLEELPDFFNADFDEGEFVFKDRSDDKGPEPEGVVLASYDGFTYAFIGLERIGGIMMYDVTNPLSPVFIDYLNTADFENGTGDISPEGLIFIPADRSPNGQNLVVASYEVSGTFAIYQIDGLIEVCEDTVTVAVEDSAINLTPIGTYATGVFDEGATEIIAFDAMSQRIFSTNGNDGTIDILDAADPENLTLITQVDLSEFGDGANSVDVFDGIAVAAVEAGEVDQNGLVVFMDTAGNPISAVTVGVLPDMVTHTPDGSKVITANEGEPSDEYDIDPLGSISIIDLSVGVENLTDENVTTLTFEAFNDVELDESIRIFGPGATVAQDLEPEYIAVAPDSRTAYAIMQENNAIAVIDLEAGEIVALKGLGFKDHSLACNGLDASNRDEGIEIRNWPILGMYQPDAIKAVEIDGATYIVSANEGDARDYDGFSEEERVGDLNLDPEAYPNAAFLQQDENLGRLNSTTATGDIDGDGDIDQIYSYGARSFSIWDAEGNLVWDSGEDLEQIVAAIQPDNFNANNDENDAKARSDDKGPEPEAVEVATIGDATYAFVGLERQGGIMVYDITDPTAPSFVQFVNNRNFEADPETNLLEAGDLGPEDIIFISAEESPNGVSLIAVSNEVSGSITLYTLGEEPSVGLLSRTPNPANVLKAYPNPFSGIAKIDVQVGQSGTTRVEIVGMNGQIIQRLYSGYMNSGQTYSFDFEARDLAAGMYLLRMVNSESGIQVSKLVLTR